MTLSNKIVPHDIVVSTTNLQTTHFSFQMFPSGQMVSSIGKHMVTCQYFAVLFENLLALIIYLQVHVVACHRGRLLHVPVNRLLVPIDFQTGSEDPGSNPGISSP